MISEKKWTGLTGTTTHFVSDFIIKGEQFVRVYNYSTDYPTQADLIPTTKYDIVNNAIVFYEAPSNKVLIEVATTAEEFGEAIAEPILSQALSLLQTTEGIMTTINGYKDSAAASATTATEQANLASGAKVAANSSATAAGISAGNALASEGAAASSASAANSDRLLAEAAEASASQSKVLTEGYKDDSLAYRNEAQGYRNEAEGFANDASTSEGNALASEVNAAASATLAEGYANSVNPSVVGNKIPVSTQLKGTFSLSNTVKTLGFDAITYTGNGTSQEIVTGLSTIDFTQASNGTGFYHDRVAGDCIVKNDAGTIIESGSIAFKDVAGVDGIIKVHIKSRSDAYSNFMYDGLRGANRYILTDQTSAENNVADVMTAFTSVGFTVGSNVNTNKLNSTYIAYVTLYTHIKWGLTSQGKRYIEAYNPVTNMGMIVYQGSGVAGHQIPHSLGVELDYIDVKSLTSGTFYWHSYNGEKGKILAINTTSAYIAEDHFDWSNNAITIKGTNDIYDNALGNSYVIYYKAKSKTWTIVPYTGTGSAGNFVETRDSDGVPRRPARVIIKRVDNTGDWYMFDNKRGDTILYKNLSVSQDTADYQDIEVNGFTIKATINNTNASGGQYIALVEFDTDNTGTSGSYFENPTDTTNLQLADGLFSISKGFTANGADNVVVSKSGTIIPTNGWED